MIHLTLPLVTESWRAFLTALAFAHLLQGPAMPASQE